MPYRILGLLAFSLVYVLSVRGQDVDLSFLTTRPEATDYEETTRYDEVRAFLDVLAAASERMHLTHFGYTMEGRALPLMVVGEVEDASPEAVRSAGKLRIYVQGAIHAGEVAGKEAALMLLRKLAAGHHAQWADSLVLLVAPIYNADGNERIRLDHRSYQLGPMGGMGQRPNAQGLDLNRDHMKLDAPEARSLVRLLRQYDPHVIIDLHTTNGTYHGYHLTYSPPLHPDTPPAIDSLLRQNWLPAVTQTVKERHGWDLYYYGNLPWPGMEAERGWFTFDYRPRFSNNYAGLRGRFGVLGEAYAYASFEERILASLYFVEALLDYAAAHAHQLQQVTATADETSVVGEVLTLHADYEPSEAPVEILLGEVEETQHPYTGATLYRRLDVQHPDSMTAYGRFAPDETETAPRVYFVPSDLAPVVDRLIAHGVRLDTLQTPRSLAAVQRFRIDSMQLADEVYQGHRARTLFGGYESADVTLPAGTLIVPVDQALGRLVFALLEPRAADGLVHWGLLDEALDGAAHYPILRLPSDAPSLSGGSSP